MNIKLLNLVLQYIPEGLVLSFLITIFLKQRVNYKKIMISGFFLGALTFFFRLIPLTFAYHTILSITAYTVMMTYIMQVKIMDSFLTVLKVFIILAVVEMISINSFILMTSIPLSTIQNSYLWRTLAVLPQLIILAIIGFVFYQRYKKKGSFQSS